MQAICLLQHNNPTQNQSQTLQVQYLHNNPTQNKLQTSQVQYLQVLKSNKILFITSNQQYSFTFARIEKHSQYEFKPPYNTMQTTRLLQHNNPPQNKSQISQL